MGQYKVITIAHQLKNQVIAKFGDVVDETQLNGNVLELVNAGFVEALKEPNEAVSEENLENDIDVVLPKDKFKKK